jgi:hypothetical protein
VTGTRAIKFFSAILQVGLLAINDYPRQETLETTKEQNLAPNFTLLGNTFKKIADLRVRNLKQFVLIKN